ncbi:MAG: amidohydrolase [Bacteroidota bacterium]
MQDLHICLIQSDLHWQDKTANLAMFEEKIWQIDGPTDLIVLPEMFNTGFSMEAPALAEAMNLNTFKWMRQMAAQTGAVLTGSYIVQENGYYFNRLIWMEPDGNYDHYDKRHLFRMAKEHETFKGGDRKIVKDLKGWKIFPLICYDLRFPVWSRNVDLRYDVLLYVANWPEVRRSAWNILLAARAVENLCYTIGLNRVGEDGKGISYAGDSTLVDYKGQIQEYLGKEEGILSLVLKKDGLENYRAKFPAHLDADYFTLEERMESV